MRTSQTCGALLESVKPQGPTGSRSCSLRLRSPQPRRKVCKQSSERSLKPAFAAQHHVHVHVDLQHRRAVAPRRSPTPAGPEHHEASRSELKSRMKSGASASTQLSASSASMSMRMGSSHLCSRHLPTLSEAHSVSALANRPAGRCGLGAGTPAVAARAAVASLRALWVRAAGPRAREMALCS